jgi:hypothetical protein
VPYRQCHSWSVERSRCHRTARPPTSREGRRPAEFSGHVDHAASIAEAPARGLVGEQPPHKLGLILASPRQPIEPMNGFPHSRRMNAFDISWTTTPPGIVNSVISGANGHHQ